MAITIKKESDGVDWQRAAEIYSKAFGCDKPNPKDLKLNFDRSTLVCFAYMDNLLVGFGRSLTDYRAYAGIYDVVVMPEFQRRGIGKRIMESLLGELQGLGFIHLTSTPGNEGFYKKLGFREQKTALAIMQNPDSDFAKQYIK
jgi:ribosomal protein S18 acetylase RimI-like enzyme